jgi:hypothetical protein
MIRALSNRRPISTEWVSMILFGLIGNRVRLMTDIIDNVPGIRLRGSRNG